MNANGEYLNASKTAIIALEDIPVHVVWVIHWIGMELLAMVTKIYI